MDADVAVPLTVAEAAEAEDEAGTPLQKPVCVLHVLKAPVVFD